MTSYQNLRSITCDSCCDAAVEYDSNETSVDSFSGKIFSCQSCSVLGRVDIDGEYNIAQVRFLSLDKEDLSYVDFGIIVDAYEASQKKIEELYGEVHAADNSLSKMLEDICKLQDEKNDANKRIQFLEEELRKVRRVFAKAV